MKFSLTTTFCPLEEYIPLAITADECGWNSVNIGDGLFFFEETSVDYPYSDDGSRYWTGDTPFPDPFAVIPAMAMVTRKLRFFINVLKLPVRNPMLVAKTAGTVAALTRDRLTLGVGLSPWPEDYTICGQKWAERGPRCAEMIHILRKAFTGEMFEHHGKFYDIPRLQISPVGRKPVPILIGGTASPVLRRAARIADGFVTPSAKLSENTALITEVNRWRKELGTDQQPFEMICGVDTTKLDTYHTLAEMGVTQVNVAPWFYVGGDWNSPIESKIDAIKRYTDKVVSKLQ